ncbi:Helicase C-terminal [Penicillium mononematosum]|uniref:Helicase C-terminal n=1 Tax=Penicillium mononematosum TaxID=268346 RepID=UPI002547F4CA|nr:Helicase C-terminal [Penicillium mononematosum]KAJ6185214.1 Helicase C-terminal [Penicillium mononematosum]
MQKNLHEAQQVSLSRKETTLAAYLGLSRPRELRKALIQFPTLPAWRDFQAPAKNLSKRNAFALLDNNSERGRIADTEDPSQACPVGGDNGTNLTLSGQSKDLPEANKL